MIMPLRVLKGTVQEFLKDECTRMAAALSYYVVFALPPLLVLLLVVLGAFLDPEEARGHVQEQFSGLLGPGAADGAAARVDVADLLPTGRARHEGPDRVRQCAGA